MGGNAVLAAIHFAHSQVNDFAIIRKQLALLECSGHRKVRVQRGRTIAHAFENIDNLAHLRFETIVDLFDIVSGLIWFNNF